MHFTVSYVRRGAAEQPASLWSLPQSPLILEYQVNGSEVIVYGEEPNDSN